MNTGILTNSHEVYDSLPIQPIFVQSLHYFGDVAIIL